MIIWTCKTQRGRLFKGRVSSEPSGQSLNVSSTEKSFCTKRCRVLLKTLWAEVSLNSWVRCRNCSNDISSHDLAQNLLWFYFQDFFFLLIGEKKNNKQEGRRSGKTDTEMIFDHIYAQDWWPEKRERIKKDAILDLLFTTTHSVWQ